jgi:branched-chain amino acid aminotransferase
MIGTQDSLGVGPSNSALLYTILSPVGPYYASGFEPVNLFASDKYVRAWPGGTGDCKLGAYVSCSLVLLTAVVDGCCCMAMVY